MAVQIGLAVRFQCREGQAKPDHARAIVSAQNLATGLAGHHEHRRWYEFGVAESPDALLERDRFGEFLNRCEPADLDHRCRSLACCHSSSISAIPASSNFFPRLANSRSIWAKRWRNLALVFRSACSGSTLT